MGTWYRPVLVFAGAAAAFAVHVALAVIAGELLGLLPHRAVQAIAAGLFGIGAVLLWRQHSGGGDDAEVANPGRGRRLLPVAGMAFAVVFVAEFGDLTQILTVSLAAWRSRGLASRPPYHEIGEMSADSCNRSCS